ncbi:zinc-binding dehydrogenase [Alteribacillus sp. YIM 98480]|uniref:zinc-dependent alcohol dehydrogenase n=1 Tax=Alteribacillus sp. YIM 98480 TaxID=2606599 RepID=UPI0018EEE85E|nr:alcohol dehydrogenase catalytic domain-containing protein [Alteribacillus sp. YIM 98480]
MKTVKMKDSNNLLEETEKMKAVNIKGPENLVVEELSIPDISSQEVLIKMNVCGICHSDYELISGQYIIPFEYPITPGHEWAGEIVKVGSGVDEFKVGDRVTGECVIGCGTCSVCQSGNFSYCPNSDHFGFTLNGGDAEYLVARPEWLHLLPEQVDDKTGALIEPFSVGYYAINVHGGIDAGDWTVILGGGPIGLCTLAAAKGMGSKTILVEPIQFRRDIGEKLGADITIDPLSEDVLQKVKDVTNGLGADLVVEASGNKEALKSTFDLAKNNGNISFTGINIGQEITVELGKIQIKGLNIKGTVGSPYVWGRVVSFLQNNPIDLSPIVTHEMQLEDAEKAFKMANTSKDCIKLHLINK